MTTKAIRWIKMIWPMLLCGFALAGGAGCRKRGGGEVVAPPVVAPELAHNGISGLPGWVYASQAKSQIPWQPWTKATFDRARLAKRLVFVVVALPQNTSFHRVLSAMERDPGMVAMLRTDFVPVLLDGLSAREVGLVTADLAAEIKRPVQLPMFIWMTPDVNPVAWMPVRESEADGIRKFFDQSSAVVSKIWAESPEYMLRNSALDNANRKRRMVERRAAVEASAEPAADVLKAVRQLSSLYDPIARSFDETGGLFPAGSMDLLASAMMVPGMPEEIRTRCADTLRELLDDLLPSAMFDPLDGGLFASRRSGAWALPVFERDCDTQARAVVALLHAYQATGSPLARARALEVLAFAEKSFATADGLFAMGASVGTPAKDWMWSMAEVRSLLPAADADWWISATGMAELGNLPSEADPRREFFRRNTLAIQRPLAEIAKDLGLTPEAFKPRFEAACAALRKARDARLGVLAKDETANAISSLRMVSAFAAAYTATGENRYRERAVALLGQARKVFGEGADLWMYPARTEASVSAGRAFLYALAMQAALDVVDITGDESWLNWSDDLATVAAERFVSEDMLRECPVSAMVLDLPVADQVMMFDDSTAGLISFAEGRMAALGRPLVDSFSRLAVPLPLYSLRRPVLHTDLIQATLIRHHGVRVLVGKDLSPAMKTALERLPLRIVRRQIATDADAAPAGAVKITLPDGSTKVATTPEELEDVVLPSGRNQRIVAPGK